VAVGALPVAVRSAAGAAWRPVLSRIWVSALILLCYALIAIWLTKGMWAAPSRNLPTTGGSVMPDVTLSAWFLRYIALAVSHGHLPALTTSALNWPQGINLMWNTSLLLPGVLLTPVTLIWGPVVGLNVLLVLGFAGSAASLYWVLRRWGASQAAAAIGGALYGFSPAMRMVAEDHYHIQFAVLPPLIIDAVARLAVGRPGRFGAIRTGIWLGLLVAGQLFVAEEMLVDTALASVVVVVALLLSRPLWLLRFRTVGAAAAGAVIAAGVALALTGHALRVQFHGPLTETGSPWALGHFGNDPADFIRSPTSFLLYSGGFSSYLISSGQRPEEYLAFLGWPLLVLIVLAAVYSWRDMRARTAAVCWAVLDVFSIGGHRVNVGPWTIPGNAMPWRYMERLPLVGQIVPDRLSILADGAAAALLAFTIDRIWRRAQARQPRKRRLRRWLSLAFSPLGRLIPDRLRIRPVRPAWLTLSWLRRALTPRLSWPRLRRPRWLPGWLWPPGWPRRAWLRLASIPIFVIAILPIVPLPMATASITPVPAGWTAMIDALHLPPGAPVLMLPVNAPDLMQWQAQTGAPFAIVGGYCITPAPNKHATSCGNQKVSTSKQLTTARLLNWIADGRKTGGPNRATILAAMLQWRPVAVVAEPGGGVRLNDYLISFFGKPTAQSGGLLGWRLDGDWQSDLPPPPRVHHHRHHHPTARLDADHYSPT
jgi:hypothetical protein